jgi:uncharacterized protein (TIGR02265 family)
MSRRAEPLGLRGASLLWRIRYVQERFGEAGLREALDLLSPAEREVLGGRLLATGWYPLELGQRLDDVLARALSPGDRRWLFLELGRACAQANLTGPQRHLVAAGDPMALLESAPILWAAYHSAGRCSFEETGATSGVLRTFDAECVSEDDCLAALGWFERAIELCGGSEVQVTEEACRARGDDHCRYRCQWKMASGRRTAPRG